MEFTVQSNEDLARISVVGAVTQKQNHLSDEILRKLLGPDIYKRKLLLSFQQTNFLDSSGINWLLICHKRFTEAGGRMVLHSVPPLVDNVLKILRLDSVFEIAADEATAETTIRGPAPQRAKPKPVVPASAITEEDDEPADAAAEGDA